VPHQPADPPAGIGFLRQSGITPLFATAHDPATVTREPVQAAGVEGEGVCLLNAYRNRADERGARDAIRAALSGLSIILGSLRALAAVMNAHMQPIVARYQAAFAAQSVRQGIPNRPPIMLSNGGVVGTSLAGA